MRKTILTAVLALGMGITVWLGGHVAAQEGLTRTVLMKKDLEADPKKEVTVFIAEYKPGAKSGKHYHPGQEFIYVLEGEGVMEEGRQPWRSIGFVKCATPGCVARIPWSYMREKASAQW